MISAKKNSQPKANLEIKIKEAKENTDPVIDLTNCSLKGLPPNIFSLCKTLKKEVLYLQKNQLSSFGQSNLMADLKTLKILDLSFNKFTKIPPGIEELNKLEVLKINDNYLRHLPEEIGNLNNLIDLNVGNNNLKSIPPSLGNCISLQVLNLKKNKYLTELPVTLGKLKCLVELEIDSIITFPPAEVWSKGTNATIHFLAKELEGSIDQSSTRTNIKAVDFSFKNLEEKVMLHEKDKGAKQKERLKVEEQLKSDILKEIEVQNEMKTKRKELLETIKNEQDYLAKALAKVQEKKGIDRDLLIKLCQEEEKNFNDTISKILRNNERIQSNINSRRAKEELEKLVMKNRSSAQLNEKEKKLVLESMDKVMKNEINRDHQLSAAKNVMKMKSVLAELNRQDRALEDVFKKFDKSQKDLIKTLKSNEILQKSAVASLIEKNDATSWELKQQIIIVEQKLIDLTRLELSKKKLESQQLMTELNKKRIALTKILLDLFDQQETRRQLLIDTLRKMEIARADKPGKQNYWMEQYKSIQESKSAEVVKYLETIDPVLISKFFENGVFQFLPMLQNFASNDNQLKLLNDQTLVELGINSEEDRRNIIQAINSYFGIKKSRKIVPSAPPEEAIPSAPPIASSHKKRFSFIVPEECVICLDAKPNVIFIPCGHVCCCFKCFSSIALCPICRVPIDTAQKVLASE